MIKKIIKNLKKTNVPYGSSSEYVKPFAQQPPQNFEENKNEAESKPGKLSANTLFTLFTADIIKKRKIFTR